MKISQEPIKISDILKDKTFTIPLYQREYSWNLEQVSDLYYDIVDSDDDGHFIGSLLLYELDKKKYKMEIVDGQQRTTTIFLLLFCILKILDATKQVRSVIMIESLLFITDPGSNLNDTSRSDPRLETGKRDKSLFKSIIKNEDFSAYKDGRRRSHKNLTNTLDFFDQRISEILKNQGLDGIVKLTQKVINSKFIVMTAEKQSDKLQLFKTINARGLELTQGDLIKNELCRQIELSNIDEDIDEAVENWDKIRSMIEENGGDLDVFLFHYLNSLDDCQNLRAQLDKKHGVEKWEKKNYPPAPEKYVFDLYAEIIEKVRHRKFLSDLLTAANNYALFIKPANDKIHLNSLKAMAVNKCFPLLLNAIRKLSSENFNSICKHIDSLTFRHSILRKDPKELERFYYQLSESITDDENIRSVINKIKDHANFREEDKFKMEFISASPKRSVSRMILDRITKNQGEGVDWSNKDVHIEHIMPQNPIEEWKLLFDNDKIEYEDYLNRLGNLTILQDRLNIRASNNSFNTKKEFYKSSHLAITNSLTKYNNWGYDQILKRQEELYELARDFWN